MGCMLLLRQISGKRNDCVFEMSSVFAKCAYGISCRQTMGVLQAIELLRNLLKVSNSSIWPECDVLEWTFVLRLHPNDSLNDKYRYQNLYLTFSSPKREKVKQLAIHTARRLLFYAEHKEQLDNPFPAKPVVLSSIEPNAECNEDQPLCLSNLNIEKGQIFKFLKST